MCFLHPQDKKWESLFPKRRQTFTHPGIVTAQKTAFLIICAVRVSSSQLRNINSKMDILAQVKDQSLAFVNTIINLNAPENTRHSLATCRLPPQRLVKIIVVLNTSKLPCLEDLRLSALCLALKLKLDGGDYSAVTAFSPDKESLVRI